MKQLPTLSFAQTPSFQLDLHGVQFHLTDDSLEAQDKSIVRIMGVKDTIFICNQRIENRTDFEQIAPAL